MNEVWVARWRSVLCRRFQILQRCHRSLLGPRMPAMIASENAPKSEPDPLSEDGPEGQAGLRARATKRPLHSTP